MLIVTLRDDGVQFDPLAEAARTKLDLEEPDQGGMGIRFIQTLATEATWGRDEDENVLTLKFKL